MTPISVRKAKLEGDTKELSRLGKLGAQRKKERVEALREYILRVRLHGALQMAREAHEDIAPLTD